MHIERNRHNNRRKNARGICRKHVPGSINIPLVVVEKKMKELDELPKPIIAYCKSGTEAEWLLLYSAVWYEEFN